MNIEALRNEAMLLPPQERAQLAEQLLSSLDVLTEPEIEQLWLQEAARRAEEMDKGLVQRIPADVVHQEALALLKWIIFSIHKARAEHLEHVAYYQCQRYGLGARYLAAFTAAMVNVCEAPQRYKIKFPPDVRQYRVAGFPYNILYRCSGEDIEVLAVAPHRRRPDYWLERL